MTAATTARTAVATMVTAAEERGVEVIGDDFYLDPSRLLPARRIRGKARSVTE